VNATRLKILVSYLFVYALTLFLYVLLCLFLGACASPSHLQRSKRIARASGAGKPLIATCTSIARDVVRCTVYDGVEIVVIEYR
jgi:hypothetical protein